MPTKTILVFFLFIGLIAKAQTQINDSASIGANYANQTFYSLAYGTVSSIDNSDWDLAFHADKREASIFINSKKDVKLYLASNELNNITIAIAAGYLELLIVKLLLEDLNMAGEHTIQLHMKFMPTKYTS